MSTQALSPREKEVINLVAKGLSNSGIASHLEINKKTVENHMRSILLKLDVDNRTQAVIISIINSTICFESLKRYYVDQVLG